MKKEGSKEIREFLDYAHLYLGCKDARILKVVKSNYYLVHEHGIHKDDEYILMPHLIAAYELHGKGCIWKLILRPLSSMTEEEKEETKNLSMKLDVCAWRLGCAEITHYLLKRHFDLFGLIESGLAIDATTLNTSSPHQSKTSK